MSELLLCYNRGCGQKFDPKNNKNDSCVHHPGMPVFHDAYKGWSCCNKKCTDFTEFLNIKGCSKSFHTNEKPVEPQIEKPKTEVIIEHREPVPIRLERPSFNLKQVEITPSISPGLIEQLKHLTSTVKVSSDVSVVKIGENCKNKACKATYKDPDDKSACLYHPGVPIFHEGLKFWSCCQKKTTDFAVFLEQVGCTEGQHVWTVQNVDKKIQCRMDWHQTGIYVVVSIFAKKYQPEKSFVKINPVRLTTSIYFPEENSSYDLDLELNGIIDVEKTSVQMLPTKVEIKMRKAEPGSWSKLHNNVLQAHVNNDEKENNIIDRIDAVDLSDL